MHVHDAEGSKETLLRAAASVFARHGYDGATVKELAEAAGVNVSLVSYYFDGKEGPYRAVLESFGRSRLASAERALKAPESAEEFRLRLGLFLDEFIEQHVAHPQVATIIHRDCVGENPIINDLFQRVFVKVFETLLGFFVAAQEKGIVRRDLSPLHTCGLFFGGIIHMIRMQHRVGQQFGVRLEDPACREELVRQAVANLTEGVFQR